MSHHTIIRDYREGDEAGIISLLNLVFKVWPSIDITCSHLDHWHWKYRDNHFDKVLYLVAEQDGKIVGFYPVTYHAMKIGEVVHNGSIGTDACTHPDLRGQGIWSTMADCYKGRIKELGDHFLYYLTGNQIVIKHMSKIRPKLPYNLCNLVNIKDVDYHLEVMPTERDIVMKAGFKVVSGLNTVGKVLREKYSKKGDFEIECIDSFDDAVDVLWSEASPHYLFIGKRDQGYLNYRYFDRRGGTSIVYQARSGERVLGYIVARLNKRMKNYPVGFIVDLLTVPNRLDVADALIERAMQYFEGEKVNLVNYLNVKRHPYNQIFARRDFVDCMVKFNVFYNYGQTDHLKALGSVPPSKMMFTWGDHDSLPLSIKRS